MSHAFDDILAANARYAETFDRAGAEGRAEAGLAVITCMDARVDPLPMLGLRPGDAKVIRNAGGRVTPRVLEALVLATHLLDKLVDVVCVDVAFVSLHALHQ